MKPSTISEAQIALALKQVEGAAPLVTQFSV